MLSDKDLHLLNDVIYLLGDCDPLGGHLLGWLGRALGVEMVLLCHLGNWLSDKGVSLLPEHILGDEYLLK